MEKKSNHSNGTLITGNLEVIRDFSDVRDVVLAYYLLLHNGKNGEVYNVCSGEGISLRGVISIMADILNVKISITVDETLIRPDENIKIIGCNQRIRHSLGWAPQYTLRESLSDTLNYWAKLIDSFKECPDIGLITKNR
jgi:GDP-4-dehydro-6-deoxy-D-mannose reductase